MTPVGPMGSAFVFDKSQRTDGALSRSDFSFDPERNLCSAPPAESRRNMIAFSKPRDGVTKGAMIYFAGKHDRRALRR